MLVCDTLPGFLALEDGDTGGLKDEEDVLGDNEATPSRLQIPEKSGFLVAKHMEIRYCIECRRS